MQDTALSQLFSLSEGLNCEKAFQDAVQVGPCAASHMSASHSLAESHCAQPRTASHSLAQAAEAKKRF